MPNPIPETLLDATDFRWRVVAPGEISGMECPKCGAEMVLIPTQCRVLAWCPRCVEYRVEE